MEIKQVVNLHFIQLFTKDGVTDNATKTEFLSNIPSLVSAESNAGLVKPFSEKYVVEVIWGMEPDKAHGMDGFSIHFYRVCWLVIKHDFLHMVSTFLKKAKVGGCTNSTILALIPKEVNPTSFDRF